MTEVQCQYCHRYTANCHCREFDRKDKLVKAGQVIFVLAWLGLILGWRIWEVLT